MTGVLRIVSPGVATTVQDAGRFGFAHLGLGSAGFVDRDEVARLNRAVGNEPNAAVIESAGGCVIEVESTMLCAASGWVAPRVLAEGERFEVRPARGRQWAYVALSGGVDGDARLGSLSADSMALLNPVPLETGTRIATKAVTADVPADVVVPSREVSLIRLWPGPQPERLGATVLSQLTSQTWTIRENSRVGVRLGGHALTDLLDGGLASSEPMIVGAIQLPPDGMPIILSRDHPVTGGYPIAAVIEPLDLSAVLGRAYGESVRFTMA